jgi:energy-coupling factor transporter ATP-binding protein EcfA2
VTATLTVNRITLTGFRNYGHLRLETGGTSVVLTGPNGAGKTNLLEAVSLLAPGRGLRGAPFDELVKQGEAGWAVSAELEAATGPVKLGTAYNLSDGTGEAAGRQVTVDGIAQKGSGTLGHHVRILWLTPAMDRLFAGPASDRRRFLDRLVLAFDPDHSARVLAFEKAMRERNRLLAEPKPDARWLSGLEVELAGRGVAVAAARLAAIEHDVVQRGRNDTTLQRRVGRFDRTLYSRARPVDCLLGIRHEPNDYAVYDEHMEPYDGDVYICMGRQGLRQWCTDVAGDRNWKLPKQHRPYLYRREC